MSDERRCACGAPERCWPESETCAFMDTGYPWCRVCKGHHRAPECVIDGEVLPPDVGSSRQG